MFKCHLSRIRSWPVNKPSDLPLGVVKQNIQLPCEGHVLLLQRRQWRCCNEGHRSLSNSFRGSWHNDRRFLKFILNIDHNLSSFWLFDYIQWISQFLSILVPNLCMSVVKNNAKQGWCITSEVLTMIVYECPEPAVSLSFHRHQRNIAKSSTVITPRFFVASEVFTPETARCLGACALTQWLKRVQVREFERLLFLRFYLWHMHLHNLIHY